MTAEKIIETLKGYCNDELRWYNSFGKTHGASIRQMTDRCYGAVMYASCILNPESADEIGKWWDDEMRPKLYNLF